MALTKVTEGIRTLGTDEVIATNIATDAVTTGKILDDNVTIAKIAGSAAAAADTFLKKDGTWSTVASGTSWQSVKTGDFTAVAGEGYPCNTTSGRITVTLPTPPSVGDTVEVVDYAGTFDTNYLQISPAGSDKLKGGTDDLVLIKERSGAALTFVDATQGWVATSGINEGTDAMSIPTYEIEALITAGGGSGTGFSYNGGGGAGGLLYYGAETPKTPNGVAFVVNSGVVYTATIGGGGATSNGTDTVFSGTGITTQTAVGGGQGSAVAGGSGGGAGHGQAGGGGGTAGQGSSGGSHTYSAPSYPSGGGGGAGGSGGNGTGGSSPGNGGAGLNYVITGSSVNYSAGGGGGSFGPLGAAGGDSAGAGNVAAPDGRGGGGGAGKDGGDGCVILRMPTADYSGTTTGSPTVTTDGSYTILNFIVSGTYTS